MFCVALNIVSKPLLIVIIVEVFITCCIVAKLALTACDNVIVVIKPAYSAVEIVLLLLMNSIGIFPVFRVH